MATAPTPPTEAPALLPVAEAAQALGVSISAVRRGLKSGRYRGQRQATPQGFVWLVEVGAGAEADDRVGELRVGEDRIRELRIGGDRIGGGRQTVDHTADHAGGSPDDPSPPPQQPPPRPPDPQTALLAQRAEEMARYTATLLEPWRQRVEELSRENGSLEARAAHLEAERDAARAELEQARALADEARRDADERARLAEEGARRPWWRFW